MKRRERGKSVDGCEKHEHGDDEDDSAIIVVEIYHGFKIYILRLSFHFKLRFWAK